MAHFAEIDENNIVLQVLVVPDPEEHRGQEYLSDDIGLGGVWVQTSYNGTIRKNFAGIGYLYDEALDAFIPPKPYESWTLNLETCTWEAPRPYPEAEALYGWDEESNDWIAVEFNKD